MTGNVLTEINGGRSFAVTIIDENSFTIDKDASSLLAYPEPDQTYSYVTKLGVSCGVSGKCVNLPSSGTDYRCECRQGFTGDPVDNGPATCARDMCAPIFG